MTERRINIRPGLSPGLAEAIAADAERHGATPTTHVVAVLAEHYGTPAPESSRHFDQPAAARAARAKVVKPGRRPKKS